MIIPSLVALMIASILKAVKINLQEEVFNPVIGLLAILFWLVSVLTAPWILQSILLLVPLILVQVRIGKT